MKKFWSFCKLLALFIFNSVIIFFQYPILLTVILLIMLVLLYALKSPLKKRLKTILPIAFIIIIFQLIFNNALPVDLRLMLGYVSALKITLISLSVLLFLSFVSLVAIVDLFSFLPRSWLLLLLLTFYMIPSILNESDKIKIVQYSRGATLRNRNYLSNLAAILLPLLHRVFQRAEILSYTIVSRGYDENVS